MKEFIYKSNRGKVHYFMSNSFDIEKPTLVFLHGLTADHRLFEKQVAYFKSRCNLIVWDAPAHGKSRPYVDFTYFNAAEDLKGILNENAISSAVLIGQSMGGYVSQSFILRYPQMVSAFIAIDSCPYGESYYSKSDKWWLRQVEWMSHLIPLKAMKKAVAKQCTRNDYAYKNMLTMLEPYEKNELCHLMGVGYAGFLGDNCDMDIPCPTLLLAGQFDKTGKVLSYNRAWTEKTGFPLRLIANAAHNSNADNPDAVNKEIELFLAQIKK